MLLLSCRMDLNGSWQLASAPYPPAACQSTAIDSWVKTEQMQMLTAKSKKRRWAVRAVDGGGRGEVRVCHWHWHCVWRPAQPAQPLPLSFKTCSALSCCLSKTQLRPEMQMLQLTLPAQSLFLRPRHAKTHLRLLLSGKRLVATGFVCGGWDGWHAARDSQKMTRYGNENRKATNRHDFSSK